MIALARGLSREDQRRLRDLLSIWVNAPKGAPGDAVAITDPVDLDGAMAQPSSSDESD